MRERILYIKSERVLVISLVGDSLYCREFPAEIRAVWIQTTVTELPYRVSYYAQYNSKPRKIHNTAALPQSQTDGSIDFYYFHMECDIQGQQYIIYIWWQSNFIAGLLLAILFFKVHKMEYFYVGVTYNCATLS